jgi:hypothetical protein
LSYLRLGPRGFATELDATVWIAEQQAAEAVLAAANDRVLL